MTHTEGFDAIEEGDLEKFLKRMKEIWESEKSRTKGAAVRYELTIGIRNNRAILDPKVTTSKGVKTLIIWNLKTEDVTKIKEKAKNIELPVTEVPYLWPETPNILPKEKPI